MISAISREIVPIYLTLQRPGGLGNQKKRSPADTTTGLQLYTH